MPRNGGGREQQRAAGVHFPPGCAGRPARVQGCPATTASIVTSFRPGFVTVPIGTTHKNGGRSSQLIGPAVGQAFHFPLFLMPLSEISRASADKARSFFFASFLNALKSFFDTLSSVLFCFAVGVCFLAILSVAPRLTSAAMDSRRLIGHPREHRGEIVGFFWGNGQPARRHASGAWAHVKMPPGGFAPGVSNESCYYQVWPLYQVSTSFRTWSLAMPYRS